jgi:hypothetical protein
MEMTDLIELCKRKLSSLNGQLAHYELAGDLEGITRLEVEIDKVTTLIGKLEALEY